MATFGKGLRGKQLDAQEKAASGERTSASKETPKDAKKPRTMTQAEFSGYKKGGVVGKRGWGIARCKG